MTPTKEEVKYYNENGWNIFYEKFSDYVRNRFIELGEKGREEGFYYEGQHLNMDNDFSLLHRCGSLNDTYQEILEYCLAHNIQSVCDIGTAFSWQSDMFIHNNILYHSIDISVDDRHRNYNPETYFGGIYPGVEFTVPENTIGLAVLSIGWNVFTGENNNDITPQFEALIDDFELSLVYLNKKNVNKIKYLFSEVNQMSENLYEFIR